MKSNCENPISALSNALCLEKGTAKEIAWRTGLTTEKVEHLNEHLLWGHYSTCNYGLDFVDATLEWTRGLVSQKNNNIIQRDNTYKEEKGNIFFWRGVMDAQWREDQKTKLSRNIRISVKIEGEENEYN
jgi:hypothetical protein